MEGLSWTYVCTTYDTQLKNLCAPHLSRTAMRGPWLSPSHRCSSYGMSPQGFLRLPLTNEVGITTLVKWTNSSRYSGAWCFGRKLCPWPSERWSRHCMHHPNPFSGSSEDSVSISHKTLECPAHRPCALRANHNHAA